MPSAATIGNPLDYTAMIWGDTDLLRRITVTVGADPAIDQLLILYDHPQGLAPEAAATWAAVRAGIVAGAAETEAATLVASTLPDLIDDAASGELADRGVPVVAGLRTALACAQALRLDAGDPRRLRAIASAAAQAARPGDPDAATGADGWLDEIEAKELLRGAGIAVPEGRVVASEDECAAAVRRARRPRGDEARGPPAAPQERRGCAAARSADGRGGASRISRALLLAGGRAAGGSWWSEWRRPGVELLVAARADAVVPALVVGLGGIWAEALDDVAIVPLPAEAERVEQAILSLRGAAALAGGRGRQPLDLDAAARLAAAIGSLLLESGLDLIELNPVVVHPEGCVALDALGRAPRPSLVDERTEAP